jgi:alpha-galactosidase
VSRTTIQRGFLQFFPPEIMGAHVGTAPAHTTGRSQAMAFRAAVALPGHLGVELDVRALAAHEQAELAAWIALYKRLRGRLHAGRTWLGEGADGLLWQLHGDADGAGRCAGDALLLVYRREPSTHRYTPPLALPMLDPGACYRVTEARPGGAAEPPGHRAPLLDEIGDGGAVFDGAWLAQAGLPVPRGQAESAWIVQLQRLENEHA